MKNPDEAIEQYQLAKIDRERLERVRHIGMHMPGPLTCDDGTFWHPAELVVLADEVERLRLDVFRAARLGALRAIERCKDATGQRVQIDRYVSANQCAEDTLNLIAAMRETHP